jgi:hypothetical protein
MHKHCFGENIIHTTVINKKIKGKSVREYIYAIDGATASYHETIIDFKRNPQKYFGPSTAENPEELEEN